MLIAPLACCAATIIAGNSLPTIDLKHDNTIITRSCRVRIAPGLIIADADNNGVIQIRGKNITVEFESGSLLRGSALDALPDTYKGVAIDLHDAPGAVIRDAAISGFKVGIQAPGAVNVEIDACRFDDNYRMHLHSTPQAEDQSDWLWPHENNDDQWATNYGAAIWLKDARDCRVHDCTARNGQNALILQNTTATRVYDNDFSFLSGWGIALWHASHNIIARNALDFCIRGYSHQVYNRGQDSAGILCFEQSSDNIITLNSVTHGGDGFFGFAGKAALGENPAPKPDSPEAGCNRNVLTGNDLSYAAAHGIEMTFSFDNQFLSNRLVENAICGIWGGYSQRTRIENNTITANGQAGYGAERGGVNIEHGASNYIVNNSFEANACAIHLWSNQNAGLAKLPWYAANHKGSVSNLIAHNRFAGDKLGVQLRQTTGTELRDNTFDAVGTPIQSDPASTLGGNVPLPDLISPISDVPGVKQPVGARANLRGRDKIIMGEWGPWDHQSPLVRLLSRDAYGDTYQIIGVTTPITYKLLEGDDSVTVLQSPARAGDPIELRVTPKRDIAAYKLRITAAGLDQTQSATLVGLHWHVRVFPWTVDPRKDLEGWHAESNAPGACTADVDSLTLRYAQGGPKGLSSVPAFRNCTIGNDHFGTIATTTAHLTPGTWKVSTLSDDGVRVMVDGKTVLENWTWHGPTPNNAEFAIDKERDVSIQVEHFEIDGYATLELNIAPGKPAAATK